MNDVTWTVFLFFIAAGYFFVGYMCGRASAEKEQTP